MSNPLTAEALEQLLGKGPARLTVMGLGYVGLPTALAFLHSGCRVDGFDPDLRKLTALERGESYIRDIPASDIGNALQTDRFRVTSNPAVIEEADAVVICVPTPFTPQKEPDTSHVRRAAEDIARHRRRQQLVVLRSTSYPGTTREVAQPVLESDGWLVGRDFFLAFSPERIDPGNRRYRLEDVPVVIGGRDPLSGRLAYALFGRIARQLVRVSSAETAEMVKLLENVFRNVNIALVNQMAQLCERMGLDVWEVVEAAATKPYGFMSFKPGLVGGHCIPVDPYYLAWKAREYDFHTDLIELAARVNEEMPFYVVNRLLAVLQDRVDAAKAQHVLVLGVAFKRDVDDARYSPALKVIELLQRRRLEVMYHDPYVPEVSINGQRFQSQPWSRELLQGVDCVIILTDHACFDYEQVVTEARLVFDARNATRDVRFGREKIVRL